MRRIYLSILGCLLCLGFTGCGTTKPNITPSELAEKLSAIAKKRDTQPLNARHGEKIWGELKVGMTVEEVIKTIPNSYFDDQWSDSGAVGAMGEAGIFAKNKVLVTAEIKGPFGGPSTFYGLNRPGF